MGFMKPKVPAPVATPVPVPTAPAEPASVQQTVTEGGTDKTLKKKQQLRTGKSKLTVGLKTNTSTNTGGSSTGSGLAVGGA